MENKIGSLSSVLKEHVKFLLQMSSTDLVRNYIELALHLAVSSIQVEEVKWVILMAAIDAWSYGIPSIVAFQHT